MKFKILVWDDENLVWLQHIIKELRKLCPHWVISLANPENTIDYVSNDLKYEYGVCHEAASHTIQSSTRKAINPSGVQIELSFEVYCDRAVESIKPIEYDFAIFDHMYGSEQYGIDKLVPLMREGKLPAEDQEGADGASYKQTTTPNPDCPIIVITQNTEIRQQRDVYSEGEGQIICFMEKSAAAESFEIIAGLIVSSVLKKQTEDKLLQSQQTVQELQHENQQLHTEIEVVNTIYQQVVNGQLGLKPYIENELAGIDIVDLGRKLALFFVFHTNPSQAKELASRIKKLEYRTPILLIGNRGTGKSVLCNAIASAFDEHIQFPRELLVDPANPQKWLTEMKKFMVDTYRTVKEGGVLVITADDFSWSSPTTYADGGMANSYTSYLRVLREWILFAKHLNNGDEKELRPSCKKLLEEDSIPQLWKSFEGKILWLFVCNSKEIIAEIDPAFQDMFAAKISIEFPTDMEKRKEAIKLIAAPLPFDEDALDKFVEDTCMYKTGRDFSARALPDIAEIIAGDNSQGSQITLTHIQAYLTSSRHREMVNEYAEQSSTNSVLPSSPPPICSPGTVGNVELHIGEHRKEWRKWLLETVGKEGFLTTLLDTYKTILTGPEVKPGKAKYMTKFITKIDVPKFYIRAALALLFCYSKKQPYPTTFLKNIAYGYSESSAKFTNFLDSLSGKFPQIFEPKQGHNFIQNDCEDDWDDLSQYLALVSDGDDWKFVKK